MPLDEVGVSFAGKKHWLWRAVDEDGFVLDVLVQSRRDKKAAKRLFRKLLKKQGRAPRVLITDKLKSYAAAKREIMPGVECSGPLPPIVVSAVLQRRSKSWSTV